jgi:hypothetical protein
VYLYLRALVAVSLSACAGCAPALTRVPDDHPARASAESAPLPEVAEMLRSDEPVRAVAPTGHAGHAGHGGHAGHAGHAGHTPDEAPGEPPEAAPTPPDPHAHHHHGGDHE